MGLLAFVYGAASYALFLGSFLYLMGFIGNVIVPKTVDTPPYGTIPEAIVVDVLLIALFALQHTVMARKGFKQWWTRIVPEPIERSTFVLASGLVLTLLLWKWQPIEGSLWAVQAPGARFWLQALFWAGWGIGLASTFMINHFDLFGLRQVWLRLKGEPYRPVPFVKVAFYRFVRHPLMLGLLIAFWATPDMTYSHLLFALAMTAYILVGIWFEERDLRREHGEEYEQYRREAAMLIPLPGRR